MNRLLALPVFALVAGVSTFGLRWAGVLESVELALYDLSNAALPAQVRSPSPVVVIGVDEVDLRSLGNPILSDEDVARALDAAVAGGAGAVGLDILRDLPIPPGTEALSAAFERHTNVVAAWRFEEGTKGVPPPPAIKDPAQLGFADTLADVDGRVRRALLWVDDGSSAHSSLALSTVMRYLASRGTVPEASDAGAMRLGAAQWTPLEPRDAGYASADMRGYQVLLDHAESELHTTYSLAQLLDGTLRASALTDKLIFIGYTAESRRDFFAVPGERQLPGVYLHARLAAQLLRGVSDATARIEVSPDWVEYSSVAVSALAGAAIVLFVRGAATGALLSAIALGSLLIATLASLMAGIWFASLPAMLALALSILTAATFAPRARARARAPSPAPGAAPGDGSDGAEFDVFISTKSQDYPHAHTLYSALEAAGVRAFFSEVTLAQAGDADYRETIDRCLDGSRHLIVLASDAAYLDSRWVKAEWGFFVNEQRSGHKSGNLLVVTVGELSSSAVPPALRHAERFDLHNLQLDKLLSYLRSS